MPRSHGDWMASLPEDRRARIEAKTRALLAEVDASSDRDVDHDEAEGSIAERQFGPVMAGSAPVAEATSGEQAVRTRRLPDRR